MARRTPLRRLVREAALLVMGLVVAGVLAGQSGAEERARSRLAILPIEIEDNSGEAGGAGRHEEMLTALTRIVGKEVAGSGLYEVVPHARLAEAVAAENPGTYLRNCNGCELDIARRVGADRVMIAWIFKMSTLVLTLHVVIKDVESGQVIFARAFDFRGDNERAWEHAARTMVRALSKARQS